MDDTETTWGAMAEDYEGFTAKPGSFSEAIEVPCITALLPPLEGARVLDLGCGTGRFSFLLGARGARELIGVDLSTEMLALAEARRPPGSPVRFVKASIERLDFLDPASIDFAFSSTTLHYVDNLALPMAELARVLKPGAHAVLSVMHPLYTSSYPVEGAGEEWRMHYLDRRRRAYLQPWSRGTAGGPLCRSAHHTFSDYAQAFASASLLLRGIHEPGPPEAWRESSPERWQNTLDEPIYAVFECQKG